jgi:hypothetical protein
MQVITIALTQHFLFDLVEESINAVLLRQPHAVTHIAIEEEADQVIVHLSRRPERAPDPVPAAAQPAGELPVEPLIRPEVQIATLVPPNGHAGNGNGSHNLQPATTPEATQSDPAHRKSHHARGTLAEADKRPIINLARKGRTIDQIAQVYNYYPSTIRAFLGGKTVQAALAAPDDGSEAGGDN